MRENPTLKAVRKLKAGDSATVVRLAEHQGSLLHWYYDQQLDPGTTVTVDAAWDGDAMQLSRNGDTLTLSTAQADGLFVRPAGVPEVPATATCWGDILKRETALAGEA